MQPNIDTSNWEFKSLSWGAERNNWRGIGRLHSISKRKSGRSSCGSCRMFGDEFVHFKFIVYGYTIQNSITYFHCQDLKKEEDSTLMLLLSEKDMQTDVLVELLKHLCVKCFAKLRRFIFNELKRRIAFIDTSDASKAVFLFVLYEVEGYRLKEACDFVMNEMKRFPDLIDGTLVFDNYRQRISLTKCVNKTCVTIYGRSEEPDDVSSYYADEYGRERIFREMSFVIKKKCHSYYWALSTCKKTGHDKNYELLSNMQKIE